jgi:hypothetical protein
LIKMKSFKKMIERVVGFLWFFIPVAILKESPDNANIAYLIFGVPLLIVIVSVAYGYIRDKANSKKESIDG